MNVLKTIFSSNPYAGLDEELNSILSRKDNVGPPQVYDLIKLFKTCSPVPRKKIDEYMKIIEASQIDINPIKGILTSIDQTIDKRGGRLVRKIYAIRSADAIGKMLLYRPIISEMGASPFLREELNRFPSSAVAFSFLPKGQRNLESLQFCLRIFESTGSITSHVLSLILQKEPYTRLSFIQDLGTIYEYCSQTKINITYLNFIINRMSRSSSEVNNKFISECLSIIRNAFLVENDVSPPRLGCALMIYSIVNGTDEHRTFSVLPLFFCFDCTELLGVFTENDLISSSRKTLELKCLTTMLEHLKDYPIEYNLFFGFFMKMSRNSSANENALTNTYLATTLLAYNRVEDNHQKAPDLIVKEFEEYLDAIFPEDKEMPLELFDFFLFHHEDLIDFFDLLIYFSDKPIEDYLAFIQECQTIVAGRPSTQYEYVADIRDALSLYIAFNLSDSESYQTINLIESHAIVRQRQQEAWIPNSDLIEAISSYLKLTDTLPNEIPSTILEFLEIASRENYLGKNQMYDLIYLFEKSNALDRKSVEFIKLYLEKRQLNEKILLDLVGRLLIPDDQKIQSNIHEIYSVTHYMNLAQMFAEEKETRELIATVYESFSTEKLVPLTVPGAFIAFKLLDPSQRNRSNLKMCLFIFREKCPGYVPGMLNAFLHDPELRISRLHGFSIILQGCNSQEQSESIYQVISSLENQPEKICEFIDQCMSIKDSLNQGENLRLNESLFTAIELYKNYLIHPPKSTYSLEACYREICEKLN